MHSHELAKGVLDQVGKYGQHGGKERKIPQAVLGDILSHEDPKVQAVVAGHPLMHHAGYQQKTELGQQMHGAMSKLMHSPHPEVTRALAGNPRAPIEVHHALASHPDAWTNSAVQHGVSKSDRRSEHWVVGASAEKEWVNKISSQMAKHGWEGPVSEVERHQRSQLRFVHPKHPDHSITVSAVSDVNPHGAFVHEGPSHEPQNSTWQGRIKFGHGPDLEAHLQNFHSQAKKESRMSSRLTRVIDLAEQFLFEDEHNQLAFEPSHWNAHQTNWGGGGLGRDYHRDKRIDAFKDELKKRAELRKGIQQELPFSVDKTPTRWTTDSWAKLNVHKQGRTNRSGYRYDPQPDPEEVKKLQTWQGTAHKHLTQAGFKRNPEMDSVGGSSDSAHHQGITLAYEHPSGAKVILGHHVNRAYTGVNSSHPDTVGVGMRNHAVYWGYRNDKGKKWGKREGLGQHGSISVPEKGKYYGRYDRVPQKEVNIHDSVKAAREKEGWQVVSHHLSEMPKFFAENPHATKPAGK